MLYIEEVVLLATILVCFGMILKTRIVYRKLVKKRKDAIPFVSPRFDYLWEVRESSLKSCIGYLTLAIGFLNYLSSWTYIYRYVQYTESLEANNLEERNCPIASSWVILSYCSLFQVPLGSLCCMIYTLSCCIKVGNALTFSCPVVMMKLKRKVRGIPQSLDIYADELKFDPEDPGFANYSNASLVNRSEQQLVLIEGPIPAEEHSSIEIENETRMISIGTMF